MAPTMGWGVWVCGDKVSESCKICSLGYFLFTRSDTFAVGCIVYQNTLRHRQTDRRTDIRQCHAIGYSLQQYDWLKRGKINKLQFTISKQTGYNKQHTTMSLTSGQCRANRPLICLLVKTSVSSLQNLEENSKKLLRKRVVEPPYCVHYHPSRHQYYYRPRPAAFYSASA